jgi:hypothetical protein
MSHDSSEAESKQVSPSSEPAGPADRQQGADQRSCGVICGLFIGLIVGGVMWYLIWHFEPNSRERQPFRIPGEVLAKAEGYVVPPREIRDEINKHATRVAIMNDMFFIGAFGLLLAGALTLANGLYRRSILLALLGTVCAACLGAVIGCAAGAAGHIAFNELPSRTGLSPLAITIVGQSIMLSILGIGTGLAFALLARQGWRTLNFVAFGLIAGVLAAIVFAVAASLVTPDAGTYAALPDQLGQGRLLWGLVVGGILGLLIPAAANPAKPHKD